MSVQLVNTGVQFPDTSIQTRSMLTSDTGSAKLPAGTTAQRDVAPAPGFIRWNSTLNQYEGYTGTAWAAIGGGATGAPGNAVFVENDQSVTANYTLCLFEITIRYINHDRRLWQLWRYWCGR